MGKIAIVGAVCGVLASAYGSYRLYAVYELAAVIQTGQINSYRVQLDAMQAEIKRDRDKIEDQQGDIEDLQGQLDDANDFLKGQQTNMCSRPHKHG